MTAPNLSQYFSNDPPSLFDQLNVTADCKNQLPFIYLIPIFNNDSYFITTATPNAAMNVNYELNEVGDSNQVLTYRVTDNS